MKDISKNAIICSTDINYLKYVNIFLKTLKNVETKCSIFVRLIDFTTQEVNDFKMKYNVNVILDNPNLSHKRTLLKTNKSDELDLVYKIKNIKDMRKVLYSPRSFYACHSRFLTIKELLNKNYNVLSLDCDTIILKNFDNLFDNLDYDMYTAENPYDKDKFSNEGLLLFKNNNKIKDYIDKICSYLFSNENYLDWDADHKALIKYFNENISLKLLDKKYKDKDHHDNSIMWSGDGKNKYEEKFASNLV